MAWLTTFSHKYVAKQAKLKWTTLLKGPSYPDMCCTSFQNNFNMMTIFDRWPNDSTSNHFRQKWRFLFVTWQSKPTRTTDKRCQTLSGSGNHAKQVATASKQSFFKADCFHRDLNLDGDDLINLIINRKNRSPINKK